MTYETMYVLSFYWYKTMGPNSARIHTWHLLPPIVFLSSNTVATVAPLRSFSGAAGASCTRVGHVTGSPPLRTSQCQMRGCERNRYNALGVETTVLALFMKNIADT